MDFALSPVFLILWYIMPGNIPDVKSNPIAKPSIVECEKEAHEFMAHGVPDILIDKGVTGTAFTCLERADKRT